MKFVVDLEFNLTLDNHDQLVGVVNEVRPDLTGWVDP